MEYIIKQLNVTLDPRRKFIQSTIEYPIKSKKLFVAEPISLKQEIIRCWTSLSKKTVSQPILTIEGLL